MNVTLLSLDPELLSPDTEDETYDISYFEECLKHIATIPESVPVTVSDLQQVSAELYNMISKESRAAV